MGVALPVSHQGVVSGGDCVELIPQERWLAAGREQFVFGAGIGPPWEPGGVLCIIGVPPGGYLMTKCHGGWTTSTRSWDGESA